MKVVRRISEEGRLQTAGAAGAKALGQASSRDDQSWSTGVRGMH